VIRANPSLTPDEVETILESTANKTPLNGAARTDYYGYGTLDAAAAVTFAKSGLRLALNPGTWAAPAAGRSTTVSVTTLDGPWTATSNAGWLTVTQTNGTTLTLRAEANNTKVARVGTVTVRAGTASATFKVTQVTATLWRIATTPRVSGVLEKPSELNVFQVVVPASGLYSFRSAVVGSGDVYGSLLDANGKMLGRNHGGAGGHNFLIKYGLAAGQTYYIEVRNYNPSSHPRVSYTLTASR